MCSLHPRRPFCGQGSALAGFAALAISLTSAAGMASAKPICETGCSQPLPTKNPRPDVKQMCWVEWGQTQCQVS
ncbi:hypothetical protein FXW78_54955 [Rhodococcus opacus]|nr:hypothetical protein [Rhodococcus opacus]